MSEREKERNRPTLLAVKTRIKVMGPKKSDKVRKLVPMKVPYEELRPFKRELSELRLEFLFWNWNCVSVSICKEIIDKNQTEGVELRGGTVTPDQWALARKLQKAALKLRDEMVANARREIDELRAKVQTDSCVEQIEIRNLADELVRKTQALEQSEAARRVDEELLRRLQ
ncbi:hypothetical protein AXG93_1855s1000 [Marchantia polymorpha subsp. ruderalis]|uniref:Uncharacterized protein n=1 Tax=Marchantia polymorpha subsp. ruderalis TaxID=1480154 RepID=A0A176VLH9_MARPO|nr:hypothetical protein AXG93_1855s1000 [Marchantia polymorpha subsp. ruderalis]